MVTAALPQKNVEAIRIGRRSDDVFFSGMALLILATVLVGFARTYFLAGVFRAPLPSVIIHIHGAIFSSWILLLVAQISLVSAGRVDIHRRLGLIGFGLACLMVIMGFLAATNSLARGFAPIATIALMDAPTGRPPFAAITGHPYMDGAFVWLFLLLVVAYDLWSTRKVHRATIWAGLFVIIVEQLRFPIGMTSAWHALTTWVQSIAQG